MTAGLDACGILHIEAALALSYTCSAHALSYSQKTSC